MAKDSTKVSNALSNVLVSLASEAAQDVEGICLLNSKRSKGATSVYVLPNEKVVVDLFINIEQGYAVPSTVAVLQERVKSQIESATKFKVQSVNVQVMNVNVAQ